LYLFIVSRFLDHVTILFTLIRTQDSIFIKVMIN